MVTRASAGAWPRGCPANLGGRFDPPQRPSKSLWVVAGFQVSIQGSVFITSNLIFAQ